MKATNHEHDPGPGTPDPEVVIDKSVDLFLPAAPQPDHGLDAGDHRVCRVGGATKRSVPCLPLPEASLDLGTHQGDGVVLGQVSVGPNWCIAIHNPWCHEPFRCASAASQRAKATLATACFARFAACSSS